jgi:hypothetical protein
MDLAIGQDIHQPTAAIQRNAADGRRGLRGRVHVLWPEEGRRRRREWKEAARLRRRRFRSS